MRGPRRSRLSAPLPSPPASRSLFSAQRQEDLHVYPFPTSSRRRDKFSELSRSKTEGFSPRKKPVLLRRRRFVVSFMNARKPHVELQNASKLTNPRPQPSAEPVKLSAAVLRAQRKRKGPRRRDGWESEAELVGENERPEKERERPPGIDGKTFAKGGREHI